MNVCQFAAVGVVPVANRVQVLVPLEVLTDMPVSPVAESTSPVFALVIVIRIPAMLPPLASKVKLGISAVSWVEMVAIVPVVKVGRNQRFAVESVKF